MTKSTHIQIRCTPEEKAEIVAYAKHSGYTVSDWIRELALARARTATPHKPSDVTNPTGWSAWPAHQPSATAVAKDVVMARRFKPDFKKNK
jgi:hypothetical protein